LFKFAPGSKVSRRQGGLSFPSYAPLGGSAGNKGQPRSPLVSFWPRRSRDRTPFSFFPFLPSLFGELRARRLLEPFCSRKRAAGPPFFFLPVEFFPLADQEGAGRSRPKVFLPGPLFLLFPPLFSRVIKDIDNTPLQDRHRWRSFERNSGYAVEGWFFFCSQGGASSFSFPFFLFLSYFLLALDPGCFPGDFPLFTFPGMSPHCCWMGSLFSRR